MRSADRTKRISDLLMIFEGQISVLNSIDRTDVNREAQNVLVRLFRIIFNYHNLKNLDVEVQRNHPAIDLGDDVARVAFQISSDGTSAKVKEALEGFASHNLYEKYDCVNIYILKKKQKSYSSDFSGIVPAPFIFDKERHILDSADLMPRIKALLSNEQQQVLEILEDEFGEEGWINFGLKPEELNKHQQVYIPQTQLISAESILRQEGIVILTGPPHIGKTEAGIELLSRLSNEKKYGNVLRIEQFSDWKRLKKICQRAILLDDAFGNPNDNNPFDANHFDELRRLADKNLIVITSRQDIFETARRQTRMGQSRMLPNLVVELAASSAYDTEALSQITAKHIYFARTNNAQQGKLLTDDQARLLLENRYHIARQLRFPHNIDWLVRNASGNLREQSDLPILIDKAKDIEEAVAQWYENQEKALKIFVAVTALYPFMSASDMQKTYQSACIKCGVSADDVERKARESSGYIRAEAYVSFAHPSYEEGVNRGLKEESSFLINPILQARAEYLLSKPLFALLPYRRKNEGFEEWSRFFQQSSVSQATTFKQWFKDYIAAYNHIISRDFPTIRTAFHPNWEGPARIYAFFTQDGKLDRWAHLRQHGNEEAVTINHEPPAVQETIRTQLDLETWRIAERASVVWHEYPGTTRSVPQISAMDEVLNQMLTSLRRMSSTNQSSLSGSWHLRMAQVLMALEKLQFPMEGVSIESPLTAEQFQDWASPYFESPIPLHVFQNRPRMRVAIDYTRRELNGINTVRIENEIKTLTMEGHPITGELHVSPDLSWEACPKYSGGLHYEDRYTDQRLQEAVTHNLLLSFEAYKDTVERSFPTLCKRLRGYSILPVEVVGVLSKSEEWRRIDRSVSYAVKPIRGDTDVKTASVRILSTSEHASLEEREEAYKLRERIWNFNEPDWVSGGTISANHFLELKDWFQSVVQNIYRDFDELVNGRFGEEASQ